MQFLSINYRRMRLNKVIVKFKRNLLITRNIIHGSIFVSFPINTMDISISFVFVHYPTYTISLITRNNYSNVISSLEYYPWNNQLICSFCSKLPTCFHHSCHQNTNKLLIIYYIHQLFQWNTAFTVFITYC